MFGLQNGYSFTIVRTNTLLPHVLPKPWEHCAYLVRILGFREHLGKDLMVATPSLTTPQCMEHYGHNQYLVDGEYSLNGQHKEGHGNADHLRTVGKVSWREQKQKISNRRNSRDTSCLFAVTKGLMKLGNKGENAS